MLTIKEHTIRIAGRYNSNKQIETLTYFSLILVKDFFFLYRSNMNAKLFLNNFDPD